MKKEDKELLLKDLCSRLPYGVRVKSSRRKKPVTLSLDIMTDFHIGCTVKPYLRPMSSMTEEEDNEWQLYKSRIAESCDDLLEKRIAELHDWFCKKHLDYRGLIPMELALPAPEDIYMILNNYNYENRNI